MARKGRDNIPTSAHSVAVGTHQVTATVVLFTSPGHDQANRNFSMNRREIPVAPPLTGGVIDSWRLLREGEPLFFVDVTRGWLLLPQWVTAHPCAYAQH